MQPEQNMQLTDTQADLQKLQTMLQNHDKYFDYSDDFRVYNAGLQQWLAIQEIYKQVCAAGYKETADIIFKAYYK